MTRGRRLILAGLAALSLLSTVAASFAQAPPPVPALPDTERRTSYSISSSTCGCAVNFALLGDSTDFQNWVEVWLNGVNVAYNDPVYGWAITSPTGPLANIPRPITDGVLTFNNQQTGTVQIVGARRPRRTSQYNENTGVPARNINRDLTDIIAVLREMWDKENDVTGRAILGQPGDVFPPLPPAASRANLYLCFNSSGQPVLCSVTSVGGIAGGTGISLSGSSPTTISTNLTNGPGISVAPSGSAEQISLAPANANTAKCNPTGSSAAPIDCTPAQLAALAAFVNTFTANHTIAPSDCGGTVQMGTGNTGQLTLTLPGSTSGFSGTCPIRVYNGDAYSNGNSRGKIMSGFPADVFYILFPHQSFDLKISNGAFVIDRVAGRWPQTGAELYAANGGSDTANDCLSAATACATANHVVNGILYPHIDNLNASPIVYLYGGGTFSECDVFQGQLTGVNVGFIEGNSGQAAWNTNGSCAALLIADNAEWETANITFGGPVSGSQGVFIHQTGVVDLLQNTYFAAFSAGTAIGSDDGGFINFDQVGGNIQIGPGAFNTFIGLGSGTQVTGSFTADFIGNPTIVLWFTVAGAGAMLNFAGLSVTGSATVGTATCRGPNAFTLGSSMPGGAPVASAGCQSL
jgi:hypothetical protein